MVLFALATLAHAGDHAFQMQALFVGAAHDYTQVPLALESGFVPAAGMIAPFEGHPYDAIVGTGVELGVVQLFGPVRAGVAYRWLYPGFQLQDGVADHLVLDREREVGVRGVRVHDWRFSLGVEIPARVSPFLELVGEHHGISTQLAVDGSPVDFAGDAFGFAVQGGLTIPFEDDRDAPTALVLAGSYGLYGHPVASASLGLCWRFQ